MSVTAGGEVAVVQAAPVMGVGMAACALVVGVGFLFWLGCQKTTASCEEAWERHLEEREKRRKKRLREIREADTHEMKKLRDDLCRLASESAERAALSRREPLASIQARRRNAIEQLERENVHETNRKRLKQAEEALKELQSASSDEQGSMGQLLDDGQRKQFVKELQKDIESLKRKVEEYSRIDDSQLVPIGQVEIGERDAAPGQPVGNNEQQQRFMDLIGRFYVLVDLPRAERDRLEKLIAEIRPLLVKPEFGNSDDSLAQRMNELEKEVAEAERINESRAEHRQTALDRFFALQDRYTTAANDPGMKPILDSLLQEVSARIEGYRKTLVTDEANYEDLGRHLQDEIDGFEKRVHELLLQNEQEQVKSVFERALADLAYEIVEQKTEDNFVKTVGQSRSDSMAAKVSLVFYADGRFELDLDHEPFENQSQCTHEFYRIVTKLAELGFIVDFAQSQETWLKKVKRVVMDELINLGYGKGAIVEEEFEGNGVRLVATRDDDGGQEVTIHPQKGVSRAGISKSTASAQSSKKPQTSSTGKTSHERKIITT